MERSLSLAISEGFTEGSGDRDNCRIEGQEKKYAKMCYGLILEDSGRLEIVLLCRVRVLDRVMRFIGIGGSVHVRTKS